MRYKWKKALVYIVLGIPVIFFVMLVGTFGDWHISSIFKERVYELDMESAEKSAKDYCFEDDVWTALSDDAWITVALPKKGKIDNIEIEIDFIDNQNGANAQIYYTRGDEIKGDSYVEAELVSGNNTISFPKSTAISILRFDLTSAKGMSFILGHIAIHYTMEKHILFWIVTPILEFIYFCVALICADKRIIGIIFERRSAIRENHDYRTAFFSRL